MIGHILAVDGSGVTVQGTFEPSDVDGSALSLPQWPAINLTEASTIADQLSHLLSGLSSSSQTGPVTDGPHPASYYQAFYPRTVALHRHLRAIASVPAGNKAKRSAIPYFWAEVARILKMWGPQRPASFDVLARLEVRLMDLTELTIVGSSHQPLPKEGVGLIALADLI